MFEFVRAHTRLFQFLLLIVILPSFALVGVQSYTSYFGEANSSVATVDGVKVTQTQFEAAQRQQLDRIRAQNPTIDPKLLDTPEVKKRVLDDLVKERLLQTAADKEYLAISEERAIQILRTDPSFAAMYNADHTVNQALLASQGLTLGLLAQRVRQGTSQQQVMAGVIETGIANNANAAVAFDALLQQREVQVQRFDPKEFAAKINPSDAEIEAFYKDAANAKQFEQAENAQIQYLVLDVNALKAGVTVSEEDLQNYYKTNAARYTVAEERRTSQILVEAAKTLSAADRAKGKARAEQILAEVRKNPSSFADRARKDSQDVGTAANGGDMDFGSHGSMVNKAYEDAAYSLKEGEISNVVESDFGYHIIQLTGVRGGTKQTFEQVRPQIEEEVRKQLAQKRFTEMAEQFTNMVYEQPDTLQAAADKFKLTLQSANVSRTPSLTASGPLASAKLLEAVFANDTLRNKRNTEAVETAANQLTSARVVQYNPAQLQPLSQIKDHVRDLLVKKLAAAQAVKAGQERLAALQKGGATADLAGLGEAQVISRAKAQGMPPKVLEAVMAADAAKLPAYAGVDAGDGFYVVARIDKLLPRDPTVVDAKTMAKQYAQAWNNAETLAYYEALKSRYKVTVKAPAAAASAAGQ